MHGDTLPLAILGVVFVLSRILYSQAGIQFDVDTIFTFGHYIDPLLLKTDLLRSVFFLHSQPPLLNLVTGLGLQLFPTSYASIFNILFSLTGLAFTLSIYFLGKRLGFSKYVSLTLAAWFSVSPATVVYENWYFYSHPLSAALALSGVLLVRYIERKRWIDGILFSFLLAGMALTWSLFHIAWLAGCFMIAWLALKGERMKAAWLLPAFLLVTAWYLKNAFLYDTFSTSTWGGLNLFKIVTYDIPGKVRKQWIKTGKISELAAIPPFRSPEVYLEYFPETPITGISLLDDLYTSTNYRNQHHRVYVQAGEWYWNDSLRMIVLAPGDYIISLGRSTYIFFHSASDYKQIAGLRQPVDGLDTIWNRLFYGQWQKDESLSERAERFSFSHFAWVLAAEYILIVFGGFTWLWKERSRQSQTRHVLFIFLFWNFLFVSATSIMMEIGENNRFRFTVDALAILLLGFIVHNRKAIFSKHQPSAPLIHK